jgi:hypothetical protein
MWEDYKTRPLLAVLSPEGKEHWDATFRYLTGEPIEWNKIIESSEVPETGLARTGQDHGLPSPGQDAGLSRPGQDAGLPRPGQDNGISSPVQDPGLPRPVQTPGLPRPINHDKS